MLEIYCIFFSCEFHQTNLLIAVDGNWRTVIWQLANGGGGKKNIFWICFAKEFGDLEFSYKQLD